MDKRVEENSVDGARGSVHGGLDSVDEFVDCEDDIVADLAFEDFEDGFCAALETRAAVAVADDGVVAGYFGFGGDQTFETGCEGFLEDGGVH